MFSRRSTRTWRMVEKAAARALREVTKGSPTGRILSELADNAGTDVGTLITDLSDRGMLRTVWKGFDLAAGGQGAHRGGEPGDRTHRDGDPAGGDPAQRSHDRAGAAGCRADGSGPPRSSGSGRWCGPELSGAANAPPGPADDDERPADALVAPGYGQALDLAQHLHHRPPRRVQLSFFCNAASNTRSPVMSLTYLL